jgi:hypothetical protein
MNKRSLILNCALILTLAVPGAGLSQDLAPGEENIGLFYYMTHLHPVAYFILFLIFLLSVANLYYQYVTPGGALYEGPHSGTHGNQESAGEEPGFEEDEYDYDQGSYSDFKALDQPAETIVAVRKIAPEEAMTGDQNVPTPLEGVDHPLPSFPGPPQQPLDNEVEAENEADVDDGTFKPQFIFSSMISPKAAMSPSQTPQEELRVQGFVISPNDEPIAGALVFLIDEQGKRIGQSSRSQPNSGEFTAIAQEPGNYRINAHKRGMRLAHRKPIDLNQRSGEINDLYVRMVEEGCQIKGRIIKSADTDLDAMVKLQVRCKTSETGFTRTVRPSRDGVYSIPAVPESDSCILELRDESGNLITQTDPFETIDGGEVNLEFELIEEEPEEAGEEPGDNDR